MTDLVQIGRIGRAHGIRGAVTVAPTTDDPAARFAAGSVFITDPAAVGPLVVSRHYWSGAILAVVFEGIEDRTRAETLRGTSLLMDTADLPDSDDEDEFHDHQLVGLSVVHVDGTELGTISAILHPPAAPVLVVRRITPADDGAADELVPFVRAVVPTVDLAAGRLVVDPPEGMFA